MEVRIDTPAVRAALEAGLDVTVVRTRPPSNAQESAALQGIALDELLRTIVVRRGAGDYVFVLVPGGRQIDWPKLRAHLGVNRLSLPDETEAREATGYERGAITPLGALGGPTGSPWPVVADAHVHTYGGLEKVAIGGGARGVNLHLPAAALLAHLAPAVADVTRPAP
jgi:Cys-tRNA(Pro)/Cys-tRNA(Cys) deacylase